jgi:hypothetical protein
MKTNGINIFVIVILWLFNLNPALSQSTKDYFTENGQVIIPTQIDKNPVDLISIHLNRSFQTRNAIKSSSSNSLIQPDSIIYYSGLTLNNRETYSYDKDGNLLTYLKQTHGALGWLNSELNTFIYDENGRVLAEMKQTWIGFFWEKQYLLAYTYDHLGNMLSYQVLNWEFDQWNNFGKITYTYDGFGRMTLCLEQNWANEEWQNLVLSSNHYDEKGYLDNSKRQIWNGYAWENSSRNENIYNNSGWLLSSLSQVWDGNTWADTDLYTYIYDDAGNLLGSRVQFYWETWINFQQYTYTYDGEGNNLTYLEQNWGENEWLNSRFITRTFNQDGITLSEITQEWLNTWNNISYSTFTYDENNNCLSATWFNWMDNSWENSIFVEYNYDEGMIRGIGYNWNGSAWINGDAMLDMQLMINGSANEFCSWWGSGVDVYYTLLYTGVSEVSNGESPEYEIYPNPSNQVLYIKFESSGSLNITSNIFDLSGKKIASSDYGILNPGKQTIVLNTSHLAPGMYIFSLNYGVESFTRRFSVAR